MTEQSVSTRKFNNRTPPPNLYQIWGGTIISDTSSSIEGIKILFWIWIEEFMAHLLTGWWASTCHPSSSWSFWKVKNGRNWHNLVEMKKLLFFHSFSTWIQDTEEGSHLSVNWGMKSCFGSLFGELLQHQHNRFYPLQADEHASIWKTKRRISI